MTSQTGPARLGVVVRYDRLGGIEIEGCADELLKLSRFLLSGGTEISCSLTLPVDGTAEPYDGFLSSMTVSRRGHKARISRHEDSLHIGGSEASLVDLSKSIAFLPSSIGSQGDTKSIHSHVEYYDGHLFLEPNSEPLTITLKILDA